MYTFDDSTFSPPLAPGTARPAGGPPAPQAAPMPAPDDCARATPIFHALLGEWRRMLRAVPGDRGDEEYAALAARPQFAAMLPAQTGDRAPVPVNPGAGRHRGRSAPAAPADRAAALSPVPVPQLGGPGHLPL